MNMEDFFKVEDQEPIKMDGKEFLEKTKSVLQKIYNSYSNGWQNRSLKEEEYPEQVICDKCTGCGVFIENSEEKECFQDREYGECYHRFCDYEQVGIDLENHIEEIINLSCIDEITNEDITT